MAHALGGILDQEVDEEIVQASNVSRTQQDGFGRLVNQPQFSGEVRTDKPYFLVDDTLTQGGTLASLKGYIESQGGKVIGISTLTGKQYSSKIALSPETLDQLRQQYQSTDLETWWETQYGYGFDKLTESEANYLIRAKDAERIRDKCLAAGQKGREQVLSGNAENNGSVSSENLVTPAAVTTASQPGSRDSSKIALSVAGIIDRLQQSSSEGDLNPSIAAASENPAKQSPSSDVPVWLSVPFDKKDEVKVLGAKWSKEQKCWYIPPGQESAPFRELKLYNNRRKEVCEG